MVNICVRVLCIGKSSDLYGLSLSSRKSSSTVAAAQKTEGEILSSTPVKSFTFNELKLATRNFRPDSVIGEGGFGCVFKGWLDETTLTPTKPGTGLVIAVKKLNQEGFQGHREWLVQCFISLNLKLCVVCECVSCVSDRLCCVVL